MLSRRALVVGVGSLWLVRAPRVPREVTFEAAPDANCAFCGRGVGDPVLCADDGGVAPCGIATIASLQGQIEGICEWCLLHGLIGHEDAVELGICCCNGLSPTEAHDHARASCTYCGLVGTKVWEYRANPAVYICLTCSVAATRVVSRQA